MRPVSVKLWTMQPSSQYSLRPWCGNSIIACSTLSRSKTRMLVFVKLSSSSLFFQRYFFVTLVFTDSQLYLELHIEYCLENDVFFLGICCYMIKRSLFDNPSDMRFPFNFQTERKGKFVKLLQEVDQDFEHADSSRHIITT